VVIEEILTDAMYECPGTDVQRVVINEDVVRELAVLVTTSAVS